MSPKLFILGATGYIGGDALYQIAKTHPEWEITALVRNSDKGAKVAVDYPSIKLVYGTLDDGDLLEKEASKADIIYNHVGAAQAISRGLALRSPPNPGFYIHTSGTAILGWRSVKENFLGETREEAYDDWDGITELTSFPDDALHRDVDKVVLDAHKSNPALIKTAIVCPPCIYGRGRGPDNTRSVQVYNVARKFMETGEAFVIGKGENRWHEVHVADLSNLFLKLGEAAVAGGPPATWNEEGYYLAENGEFVWGDVMRSVAKEAKRQGFLKSDDVKSLAQDEVAKIGSFPSYAFSSDSRGAALRGKKLLAWQPTERSLMKEIPTIVEEEAKALGLVKGHAEQVAEQAD